MVTGLPQITTSSQVCEECGVSEQYRSQFSKEKLWRANDILQLVYSDIYGPINPSSNGCKRYLITFVDDFFQKKLGLFFIGKIISFLQRSRKDHLDLSNKLWWQILLKRI